MVQTHLVELAALAGCLSLGRRRASGNHKGSLQGKPSRPLALKQHLLSTASHDRVRVLRNSWLCIPTGHVQK